MKVVTIHSFSRLDYELELNLTHYFSILTSFAPATHHVFDSNEKCEPSIFKFNEEGKDREDGRHPRRYQRMGMTG